MAVGEFQRAQKLVLDGIVELKPGKQLILFESIHLKVLDAFAQSTNIFGYYSKRKRSENKPVNTRLSSGRKTALYY